MKFQFEAVVEALEGVGMRAKCSKCNFNVSAITWESLVDSFAEHHAYAHLEEKKGE